MPVRTLSLVPPPAYRSVRLDDVEAIPVLKGELLWRPLRARLGIRAFGINAYTARAAGDLVVEEHDELGAGAGVTRRSTCFRADRYAQAEDRDRAIALFTEGLEEHPDSPALLYDLACVEARAGRLDDAMRHLRAAAAANPAEVPRWAAGDRDLDALRGCDGFPA